MVRHIAFLALLLISTAYASRRGGPPERIGAATLLGGALLSVAVVRGVHHHFRHLEVGILGVDVAVTGILIWLSLRCRRNWPILLSSLAAAEIVMHVMSLAIPQPLPQAYLDAVSLWSWPAQIVLMIATWRHQARLRALGFDAAWRV